MLRNFIGIGEPQFLFHFSFNYFFFRKKKHLSQIYNLLNLFIDYVIRYDLIVEEINVILCAGTPKKSFVLFTENECEINSNND